MTKTKFLISAIILTLSTTAFARVEPQKVKYSPPKIEVKNAWLRPSSKGHNAAIFCQFINKSNKPISLVSANCPNCPKVEFHGTEEDNGVTKMKTLGSIEVPARGNRTLESGGIHIMCNGLNKSIHEGDLVSLSLTFDDSETVKVNVPVKASND